MMLPLSLALLSGCGGKHVVIAKDDLCKSWRHQTVSKDDALTDKTASGIEGNNDARPAWGCAYGKNRAR
jgi:hypothetical protein